MLPGQPHPRRESMRLRGPARQQRRTADSGPEGPSQRTQSRQFNGRGQRRDPRRSIGVRLLALCRGSDAAEEQHRASAGSSPVLPARRSIRTDRRRQARSSHPDAPVPTMMFYRPGNVGAQGSLAMPGPQLGRDVMSDLNSEDALRVRQPRILRQSRSTQCLRETPTPR
jgi:hypothetical protein